MATRKQEIKNMRLISHNDLNDFGNIGEGVALQLTSDGRRVFHMAHESGPKDISSVDVTDLVNPKVITQTELDYSHLRSNSLAVMGDTLLVAYQSQQHDQPGTGMGVYDISKPEDHRRIGFYDTSGPGSKGCPLLVVGGWRVRPSCHWNARFQTYQ